MTTENKWVAEASSRGTSPELMLAIWIVADEKYEVAERVWEDGSHDDVCNIKVALYTLGHDPATMTWGASGTDWVNY